MFRILSVAFVGVIGMASAAAAQTFTRIADMTTAIPGGMGTFSSIGGGNRMSIASGTVGLIGSGSDGQSGIYLVDAGGGPLSRFVDTSTSIPAGNGNFTSYGGVRLAGSHVVFSAGNSSGIYAGPVGGGPLIRLVDRNTPVPGGTGNFGTVPSATLWYASGMTVAFNSGSGIYTVPTTGGSVTRVVDTNTPVPGGSGLFGTLGNVSVSGSFVGFRGSIGTTYDGVFTATTSGGSLAAVADINTPIPGGTGLFARFQIQVVSGSKVAFIGFGQNDTQEGIFVGTVGGGPIARFADLTSPVPGGSGTFTTLYLGPTQMAFSGTTIVFEALSNNDQLKGIYFGSTEGGVLQKAVAVGDFLDGRIVSNVAINKGGGIDGSMIAFRADFTDGTHAVYTFTPVTEPSEVLAISSVVGVALVIVRRRMPGRLSISRDRFRGFRGFEVGTSFQPQESCDDPVPNPRP